MPKKNESTCQTPQGVDEESMGNRIPVITVPKKPESTSQTPQGVDEVSMGNRIAPGYLILLSSLFCLAVVIRWPSNIGTLSNHHGDAEDSVY